MVQPDSRSTLYATNNVSLRKDLLVYLTNLNIVIYEYEDGPNARRYNIGHCCCAFFDIIQ